MQKKKKKKNEMEFALASLQLLSEGIYAAYQLKALTSGSHFCSVFMMGNYKSNLIIFLYMPAPYLTNLQNAESGLTNRGLSHLAAAGPSLFVMEPLLLCRTNNRVNLFILTVFH